MIKVNVEKLKSIFGDKLQVVNVTPIKKMKEKYKEKYYEESLSYWLDKYNKNKSQEIMEFIKSKEWKYSSLMEDYLFVLEDDNERIVPI